MHHKALFGLAFKPLNALCVVRRAQRGGNQRLGFAASKHGRAVRAWQHANFNPDIADLVKRA